MFRRHVEEFRTGGQVKRRQAAKRAKERKADDMPKRNKKNFRPCLLYTSPSPRD